MKKYQLLNNKMKKVEKETINKMQEIVNNIKIPLRGSMSPEVHAPMSKSLTKDIFATSFVVNGIMIRVTGDEKNPEIHGELYKTTTGNSPYARALAKINGEYNLKPSSVQLSEYDKGTGKIVPKYKVECNDQESKTLYINSNSMAVVSFQMMQKDLLKICGYKKEHAQNIKNMLINKIKGRGLVIEDNMARLSEKDDVKVYNIISWSPSNERSETALFTSTTLEYAENIINEITGGALDSATKRERESGDLIKFSKRHGQLGAPCTETVEIGTEDFGCMLYLHEFQGPADYSEEQNQELIDKNIIIDRNTFDGACVYSALLVVAMFAAKNKKISKSQALMMAIQSRCMTLLTKVFGEAKTQENINYRRDVLISSVDPKRILRIKPGQDVSGLDKKDYDLIIVGNEDNIGAIFDSNGPKALKDISLKDIANGHYMTYVLDVAKASFTETSGQMLQKFIAVDKEAALNVYLKLMDRQFNKRFTQKYEGEDLNVFECSLAQFIFSKVEGGEFCEVALEDLIKTELKETESQVKNFNVEIEALFLRALFDDAYFVTQGKIDGVLGTNKYTGKLEAYSYDVELAHKEQIEAIYDDDNIVDKDEAIAKLLTGVVFKYPSPSADENAVMTFLTTKQIVNRIAYMDGITKKEKEVLLDDFVNTSFGVIKMAPNNTIKHRLAGMDTDYDGVAVVFEKDLVNIILDNSKDFDGLTVKKGL